MDYASCIEIEFKLAHTFESSMEYWKHLEMPWPKQNPTNGANNPNTSQNTIEVNEKVIMERLLQVHL
jgi:hypothetical protein